MATGNGLVHEDYLIAWICALSLEMAAAKFMLDETYSRLPQLANGENTYALRKVCGHSVVVTCLPAGVYGMTATTTVVSQLRLTLPNIRFGLIVGIGGMPSKKNDIRLGDVVASRPTGTSGGVVHG
jgi:nucleoside phosphorylase